jgi:DNA-binding winged helix-turn-helix (wHTH) protein
MPAYRFGPFLLDTARRELLRDGAAVELPPKAFDVIVYLLEHRDRAVGRDELIAGVWGRVDVSDNVLDQIALRARKALGDVSEPRRCIATRPRFGFAWVAQVEAVDRAAQEALTGAAVRQAHRERLGHDANTGGEEAVRQAHRERLGHDASTSGEDAVRQAHRERLGRERFRECLDKKRGPEPGPRGLAVACPERDQRTGWWFTAMRMRSPGW